MTLSKDYYQEVQEAVRESGDAFMVHNSRLALRKALQAAIELNQLIEELNDLKANTPPEVWAAME
jgi:fructose-1-phosphate kinase PfkB-like protein